MLPGEAAMVDGGLLLSHLLGERRAREAPIFPSYSSTASSSP